MFQARYTVAFFNQAGGVQDAILPLRASLFFACAVRLPDGNGGVWRGRGEIENRANGAGLQLTPKVQCRAG